MPPKKPRPLDVDGVMCTVGASGIINVGVNPGWPSEERYIVKVKPGADDETCRAKVKSKTDDWIIVEARATGVPLAKPCSTATGVGEQQRPCPALEHGLDAGGQPTLPAGLQHLSYSWSDEELLGEQQAETGHFHAGACRHCGADASHRCSRCKTAYFCNDTCIAAAWPKHRMNCKAYVQRCSACSAYANIDGNGCVLVRCSGAGCEEYFCNVSCERRTACTDESHGCMMCFEEIEKATAGIGCQCACCKFAADSYFPCIDDADDITGEGDIGFCKDHGGWLDRPCQRNQRLQLIHINHYGAMDCSGSVGC